MHNAPVSHLLDDCDRQLLTCLQKGIGLEPRPFEAAGRAAGLDGAQTLLRVHRLMASGLVRYIGGFFDAVQLGYQSTLVAMQVESGGFERASKIVHGHPGVSRSWVRSHEINFWFLLSVPAGEDMEDAIERLHELSGASLTLSLAPVRIFKFQGGAEPGDTDEHFPFRPHRAGEGFLRDPGPAFNPLEIACIRKLQEDFPLCDTPYQKIARELGMEQEDLLAMVRGLIERKFLKRIAAAVFHVRTELLPKETVAWQIPGEAVERTAAQLAAFPEVLHCCQRIAYPEFPYGLFAGVQAPAGFLLDEVLEKIEARIGKWPRCVLKTAAEPKRVRLKYYSEELEQWAQGIGKTADVSRF